MRRLLVLVAAIGLVAVGCGDDGGGGARDDGDGGVEVEAVPVAERAEPTGDPTLGGEAITAFGDDLFAAVADGAGGDENVVVSPTSIAVALAMVEPGAVNEARTQLRELLRIDDADAFHASMNALEQDLESRRPDDPGDGDPGEITVRLANAAYLQRGYPFEDAYLDAVGEDYGPVLNEVDFTADPDAVAHEINAWVADQTEDHITQLIGDGVLTTHDVFALVNALYLNASWSQPFEDDDTADGTFTLPDGSEVTVPMMHGGSDASVAGDGWVAAAKDYTGGLRAEFVLPDQGRFDEVAGGLPAVFDELEQSTGGAELVVPRFETRFHAELDEALRALGVTAPYENGNLLGIADDPRLVIARTIHETWLSMDEQGTEAAAATAVIGEATSAPVEEPVPVILDRPFLFRIVDTESGATLFLGRVMDPTA